MYTFLMVKRDTRQIEDCGRERVLMKMTGERVDRFQQTL